MTWKAYENATGMTPMEDYNSAKIKKPCGKVWFLNGDIVRVYHRDRSSGIITLYNVTKDCLQTVLVDEWFRKRVNAYSVRDTAALINRHPKYIADLVKRGILPPPKGASKDGKRGLRIRAYYSEDDVYELREIFGERRWGAPRKDGLKTNNHTPTEQELRRRMGVGILQYTRTEEGKFLPIWGETI